MQQKQKQQEQQKQQVQQKPRQSKRGGRGQRARGEGTGRDDRGGECRCRGGRGVSRGVRGLPFAVGKGGGGAARPWARPDSGGEQQQPQWEVEREERWQKAEEAGRQLQTREKRAREKKARARKEAEERKQARARKVAEEREEERRDRLRYDRMMWNAEYEQKRKERQEKQERQKKDKEHWRELGMWEWKWQEREWQDKGSDEEAWMESRDRGWSWSTSSEEYAPVKCKKAGCTIEHMLPASWAGEWAWEEIRHSDGSTTDSSLEWDRGEWEHPVSGKPMHWADGKWKMGEAPDSLQGWEEQDQPNSQETRAFIAQFYRQLEGESWYQRNKKEVGVGESSVEAPKLGVEGRRRQQQGGQEGRRGRGREGKGGEGGGEGDRGRRR